MSVTLTGTGGLGTRLGKIGAAINSLYTFLGTGDLSAASLKSVGVTTDAIDAQYASTRQDLAGPLYPFRDAMRASHGAYLSALQTMASQTLIEMLNDDTPLPSKTVTEAIKELKRQMVASSDSFSRPTVSASVAAGASNVGTGKMIATVTGKDGVQLDYIYAEAVKARCTTDLEAGATAGQETFSVTSPTSVTDTFSYDWPKGSGVSTSLNACDAASNNDGTNLLTNGGMLVFTTANQPDNWRRTTGSVGTSIVQGTGSNALKGSYSVGFVGDGSELTNIYQPFNTAASTTLDGGGTPADLEPSTAYAISAWIKLSATASAGVLEIALTDTSGTILTDAAGSDCKISVTLTNQTSWTHFAGFIRTGTTLPTAGYRLRIRLSTALTSTKTVYIDHVAMCKATELYTGGPLIALFSGATDFIREDSHTATIANDYGSKWARLLDRLFSLRALGLTLPSSGSPTVADSLVA